MIGKTTLVAGLCLVLAVLPIPAQDAPAPEAAADESPPASDSDLLYTLGYALSRQLTTLGLTEEETGQISAGLTDGILGRDARVSLEELGPQIQSYLMARQQQQIHIKNQVGLEFRETMSQSAGATVTESGLIYFEQQAGTGKTPVAEDTVLVHYHGTFPDGKVFDSSREGDPAPIVVGEVVPCFSEGILRMQTGGKSKMVCPPELAYGDRGFPPVIGPGETLVFELELLDIITPEATPEEVSAEAAAADAGENPPEDSGKD